jgi:hypothetical protein
VQSIFADQNILPTECEDAVELLADVQSSLKELLHTLRQSTGSFRSLSFLLEFLPIAIFNTDDNIAHLIMYINEFRAVCQDGTSNHEKNMMDIKEGLDQLVYTLQPVLLSQAQG